jgi:hypothetical protein
MYLNLLQAGWKLHEIDCMDITYYMRLQARELKKKKPDKQIVYIDQLGIF